MDSWLTNINAIVVSNIICRVILVYFYKVNFSLSLTLWLHSHKSWPSSCWDLSWVIWPRWMCTCSKLPWVVLSHSLWACKLTGLLFVNWEELTVVLSFCDSHYSESILNIWSWKLRKAEEDSSGHCPLRCFAMSRILGWNALCRLHTHVWWYRGYSLSVAV